MFYERIAQLPITEVLPRVCEAFAERQDLVLQAAPGAGKTTVVPLALMDQDWLAGQRILVLEPRRVAARAAAERMAELLEEQPGQRVGYSIRLESCVSELTRVEVITEGILTRRLQQDPTLEGVGLIIFDEFHERSLDSDLGLALALQARQLFREGAPLKLLVMSATLDGTAVARLLPDAELISSEGRQYPVNTHYGRAYNLGEPIVPRVKQAVVEALELDQGNILVFLPGQREIHAVARELAGRLPAGVQLAPLYGGLSLKQQRQAIAAPASGQRKVVLATNIAETSLTIEGISTVIDSGLARQARFDPGTGMTRLVTRRISRDSAEQRQGRAGRLGPGHCFRLWSEEQQGRLEQSASPEILQADLAGLCLQLLAWGIAEPGQLEWLDAPPVPAWEQALSLLETLGALFREGGVARLTPHGVRLAQLPLHPRLAHMMMVGCDIKAAETAALLAAVLSERNPAVGNTVDITGSLDLLMGKRHCPREQQVWFERTWQQARRYASLSGRVHRPGRHNLPVPAADVPGVLLASAYPDRVARRRPGGEAGMYQLANGRAAELPGEDALCGSEWLAVAESGGRQGSAVDRIFSAAQLEPKHFDTVLSPLVKERELAHWDAQRDQFIAEKRHQVGQLVLRVEPLDRIDGAQRAAALLAQIRKRGLGLLPWTEPLQQWRRRVGLLRELYADQPGSPWPDLSDPTLLETLEEWLAPYLGEVQRLADLQRLDLKALLSALLPWPLPLELERLAPERIVVPSGSSITVDYSQQPPVLAVKLQEMFGCEQTPTIADGRQPLLVHLLSPARRPLQVTQDLAGFWRGGYQEVRREMKGRYPRHPWPEDPLEAVATRHTKRRLAQAGANLE